MRIAPRLLLASLVTASVAAHASLLNPADPYGIHSRDMATARASAPFAQDFSATLSNPAALAASGESEVTLGYLYARPALALDGLSVASASNNMPLVGLRLNLSSMTSLGRDIGFGLAIGLDDNLKGLLSLSDSPSASGQFLREGRRQLLLGAGLGVEVIPKVRVGAGILLSVAATAQLQFQTSLAGKTANETMAMDVAPRFSPSLGLVVGPWEVGPVKGLSFAASYRTASWQGVRVDALAEARLGSSPLTTLPLQMTFVDAFRPEELTFGLQAALGPVTGHFALDYARWSRLGAVLEAEDTVRGGAGLQFADVLSPRFGAEVALPYHFAARAGYAFEPSPLKDPPPNALNAVDNSRHVLSIGGGYTVPANTVLLSHPASLDVAYQAQLLSSRALTLLTEDGSTVDARASGAVHALNFTLTLRF